MQIEKYIQETNDQNEDIITFDWQAGLNDAAATLELPVDQVEQELQWHGKVTLAEGNITYSLSCEACATCDKMFDLDDMMGFDKDDTEFYCDHCKSRNEKIEWIDKMEDKCRSLAESNGWSFTLKSVAQTKTRYYEIDRDIIDEDGDDDIESFIFRIGDHGSAHCSEDISLSMEAGGDDHTFEVFEKRIKSADGA